MMETGGTSDTNRKNCDRISDMTKDDLDMTGESVCVLALFGGNRGNGSKCGLSYWNVNNPATNVNTNIVASQSYQIMEHLTKSTPFSYTAGC